MRAHRLARVCSAGPGAVVDGPELPREFDMSVGHEHRHREPMKLVLTTVVRQVTAVMLEVDHWAGQGSCHAAEGLHLRDH